MASESSDEKDGTLSLKRKDLFFPLILLRFPTSPRQCFTRNMTRFQAMASRTRSMQT